MCKLFILKKIYTYYYYNCGSSSTQTRKSSLNKNNLMLNLVTLIKMYGFWIFNVVELFMVRLV